MKALSLTQPMAWAVFHGKDIENRNWRTNYRGRIIIHASLTFNLIHYRWLLHNDNRLGITVPFRDGVVYGSLIGTVDIVDCVDHHDSPWFFGPFGLYGFVLANANVYERPIPYKGRLGLFEVPESLSQIGDS